MTKEEQIALDLWREKEARRVANSFAWSDPQSAQHEEYRRLVRDDIRPPVVVDRVKQVWENAIICNLDKDAIEVIRTYGDERFVEGERAGIERAIKWLAHCSTIVGSEITSISRDLLGEPK